MKKFELFRDRFEERFDELRDTIPTELDELLSWYDFSVNRRFGTDPELVAQFDTEEEAREALSHYCCDSVVQQGITWKLLIGVVYYVEENEYDVDGDFIDCGERYFAPIYKEKC